MSSIIREFFLGRDEFKTADEIINKVREYGQDETPAEALLVFQTSKQQTWIVATQKGLYCVLDDLGKSFTRVQWFLPAQRIVANGEIIVDISSSDKTEKTGRLNIGERRNWLYSKKLFASRRIEEAVKDLIARQMLVS